MIYQKLKPRQMPLLIVAPLANDAVGNFDGSRHYLPTGGLNEESISPEIVTYPKKPSRANLLVRPHDVISARMQNTIKVFEITDDYSNYIVSTGFAVHRPKLDTVYPTYLYHFLKSKYFQNEKNKYCTGATQKAITNAGLENISIPIFDLGVQKYIAAILDKADAIRRKRQATIKLADDFLRATFLDMFGDPVTNPKGWAMAPLKDFGNVTTGNTPPRKKTEYYGDYIEWIKSDNINTPYHFLTKAAEGLSETGKKVARTVPPNSTLVTCIAGSFDCIGNAALCDREVAFNQQINAIIPNKNTDPFFMYALIIYAKKMIQNASTNSMKGMVSKGNFEQIPLLKPPTQLQQKFGSLFQKYTEKLNSIRVSERLSCNLFNSITQRAFRGEL